MIKPIPLFIGVVIGAAVFLHWWALDQSRPPKPDEPRIQELVDGQQHIGHGKIFFSAGGNTIVDRGRLAGWDQKFPPALWQFEGPYIVQREKVDTFLYLYYPGGMGLEARIRRPFSVIRFEDEQP